MIARAGWTLVVLAIAATAQAADPEVTAIWAVHRHGQTFVTWKDVAEGEAGAKYRYSLYRSDRPITADNLAQAELCYHGVLNNSAKQFGYAFNLQDRLDPAKPYAILEEGGQPLPPWSGLAVHTAEKSGQAYYAIVATDEKFQPASAVVPGQSATTAARGGKAWADPADQALRLQAAQDLRGPDFDHRPARLATAPSACMAVRARAVRAASGATTTSTSARRPWATATVCRESSPSRRTGPRTATACSCGRATPSSIRAAAAPSRPCGSATVASRTAPRTRSRATIGSPKTGCMWMIDWAIHRYGADPQRVSVGGSSMGGLGSINVGFRHPELFAAVYPATAPFLWWRPSSLVNLPGSDPRATLMADGKTKYADYTNSPRFAAEQHADMPFLGWVCGRRDPNHNWQEYIDMVQALTANHHGFAFAWNDGGHSEGGRPMGLITKYYPATKFARNVSYPAFGRSSIDSKLGGGSKDDGDREGGINLGFDWKDVIDEEGKWSVTVSNELCQDTMTVDVTPRRCQKFKLQPGAECQWTTSTGASGTVTADAWGLVTVPSVVIKMGEATVLTIHTR